MKEINYNRRSLFLILIGYCTLLFLCAILYFVMYENDPNSFAFTNDLVEQTKVKINKQANEAKIEKLNEKLNFVVPIYEQVKKQVPDTSLMSYPRHVYVFIIDENISVEFMIFPFYSKQKVHSVNIWSNEEILVSSSVNYNIEYIESLPYDSLDVISNIIDVDIRSINTEIELLEKQKGNANWVFFDFLYFSVITQTTVGYGDILPNSTHIRLIVMIQSLLGVILTVFGATLFFKKKTTQK